MTEIVNMNTEMEENLKLLGIKEEEIKEIQKKEVISRWRKKARTIHPDKVTTDKKEQATREMVKLNKSP